MLDNLWLEISHLTRLKMKPNKVHFRHSIFSFAKTIITKKPICEMCGRNIMYAAAVCEKLFKRVRNTTNDINNKPGSACPNELENNESIAQRARMRVCETYLLKYWFPFF